MKTNRHISWFVCLMALLFQQHPSAGGLVEAEFDLANFPTPLVIDNPYWPLISGTSFVYTAEDEDECTVNIVVATPAVKNDFTGIYTGLDALVVDDREWRDEDCDGVVDAEDPLLEMTFDWYAQDYLQNIWYLGEDTIEYLFDDEGNPMGMSSEGSWEAGVDGALAGILLLGSPEKGLFYRQEYLEGVAEDMAKVLNTDLDVSTDFGDFEACIKTKEWTTLEPGNLEHKFYCPGTGLVLIESLKGKTVVEALVEITGH